MSYRVSSQGGMEKADRTGALDSSSAAPDRSLMSRILPGMVSRGHGLDTLCLYLAIARTALLDLVVALGLPTPHDRAHRRTGNRNPWLPQDIPIFIALWMEGWQAASLAERFGRSRSSIWGKARQLGLPRRDRKSLFRPADPFVPVPPAPHRASKKATPARQNAPDDDFLVGVRALRGSRVPGDASGSEPFRSAGPSLRRSGSTQALADALAAPALPPAIVPAFASALVIPAITGASPLPGILAATQAPFGPQAPLPGVLNGPVSVRPARAATQTAARPLSSGPVAPAAKQLALPAILPADPTLARRAAEIREKHGFEMLLRLGLRGEVAWTEPGDRSLGWMMIGETSFRLVAAVLGISTAALMSRRTRLEVPKLLNSVEI